MALIGLHTIRCQLDEAITHGSFAKAKRLVKQGIEIARDKEMLGELFYFQAQKEIIANHFSEAIRLLDLAIQYNPKDGAAYNDRALCMIELGVIDEALLYFDKGIRVEPDYATVYHNKGWLLNHLGHHREAIALFRKALALEPHRAVTYENLAHAYVALGQQAAALKAYKKVLLLLDTAHRKIQRQITQRIKEMQRKKKYSPFKK